MGADGFGEPEETAVERIFDKLVYADSENSQDAVVKPAGLCVQW